MIELFTDGTFSSEMFCARRDVAKLHMSSHHNPESAIFLFCQLQMDVIKQVDSKLHQCFLPLFQLL